MTKSEYQQLVEFIAPKFDEIRQRFDAVDRRFDAVETRLIKVETFAEENRHLIQTVAEGVQANGQKLDAFKVEVTAEFSSVRSEMANGFGALRSEMSEESAALRSEMTEGFASVRGAVGGMDARISNLEARTA